ncbi:MAG: hypothetical protein Q9215_000620 [Flavoplaca cf. flavocitrina]
MLKSTYRPATAQPPAPSLPAGWTEHRAPTGHSYYYNSATHESTYARPVRRVSNSDSQTDQPSFTPSFHALQSSADIRVGRGQYTPAAGEQAFRGRQRPPSGFGIGDDAGQRLQLRDRPRSKQAIPGCEPWVLVMTKHGRRFVHNSESKESFWKFPQDVMKAVVEYDRSERERKAGNRDPPIFSSGIPKLSQVKGASTTETEGPLLPNGQRHQDKPGDESDEYEEVEVTDDEDDDQYVAKRQRVEEMASEQPIEFDEDDIAYQLTAMGQDYGLDPGEYGNIENEQLEEGAEGLPLSEEDANALFKDMLEDHRVNPYHPWDRLIEEGRIVEDDRYTLLPNMKTRRDVWDEWSRGRMQELKELREKEEKKDPLIPYLAFLQAKATPKLYWAEFRRKFMREPEMRNSKLSDKEREKWYRDYNNRLKLPESTLKSDLVSLLKSTPLQDLNRSTSMAALPPSMLTNIHYIALRPSVRDPLIETHISTLPDAPDIMDNPQEQEERIKRKKEREQRKALARRQMQVQRENLKVSEALEKSKGVMREGERELQQAMRVGKGGLLSYMDKDEQPPLPSAGDNP